VRCEHNCILAGPVSSRARTHSTENFRCFQEQKFLHPRQRKGANISEKFAVYSGAGCEHLKKSSQATVEQGANLSGYTQAGCEQNRAFSQVDSIAG
jgi:hypothetical protein